MKELLRHYVDRFNAFDRELYSNGIKNSDAYAWLLDRIPLFECPDKELERTYYFRWWTYRKHIKSTPEGYAVTEFLPEVPWSGKYNIINAPAAHHFREGRWLRGCDGIFSSYLRFYLNNPEDSHRYSCWLLHSAMEYERAGGNLEIGDDELKKMLIYYGEWERTHGLPCGLFYSVDDRDAMEFSISGRRNGRAVKGIRPTLNSYMYAEAQAIAYFAKKLGREETARAFEEKAQALRELINRHLYIDGFYRALHGQSDGDIYRLTEEKVDTGAPRELIGYIPFMFGIPEKGWESCFRYLDDGRVFLAANGMTTADRSHPKYLEPHGHECLWNGYVWPFATSQVLTALIERVHGGSPELKPLLLKHLELYAHSQRIELDGRTLPWIDEVMAPDELRWTSRELLKEWGWRADKGGEERGKDYNHSTFCDLVICGIVGVKTDADRLTLDPAIPKTWDYMRLEGLRYRGRNYTVIYDKHGTKYGIGKGLNIVEE